MIIAPERKLDNFIKMVRSLEEGRYEAYIDFKAVAYMEADRTWGEHAFDDHSSVQA